MAVNIAQFRAITNKYSGFQKLNKYKVTFDVPLCISGYKALSNQQSTSDTVRYLEFFCNSADIPGATLATRPILRYGYGVTEKKPGFPVFNDIMMTFYADANAINLQFFQDWINSIANFAFTDTITDKIKVSNIDTSVYELAYKEEYAVQANVTLMDNHGDEVFQITLRDFYPISIPDIKMSWQVPEIMQITVMFTYVDWRQRTKVQALTTDGPGEPTRIVIVEPPPGNLFA